MVDGQRPVWQFTNALVRVPAASAVNGLREEDRGAPSFERLLLEHTTYVDALRDARVTVEMLPPLPEFPDSMFVEDPALVFPDCAIVLRPGAPSRFGEAAKLAPILSERFDVVYQPHGPGFVDGGDILLTSNCVYIGLSARTDRQGAEALAAILEDTGRATRIVQPPPGILHLKTACSLLDDQTILATGEMARSHLFDDMNIVRVPSIEEAAANALRVNDVVFLGAGFPETRLRIEAAGFQVNSLPVHEIGKLDAGLSCMSLRW